MHTLLFLDPGHFHAALTLRVQQARAADEIFVYAREGAHKTLDASSAPDARAAAVRAVRSWGTACFVGERGQVTLDVSPDLLRRQVTLVGSWTFSKQGQAECAEFVADRRIDVEKLFTHRWRLDQAEEAYKLFDTQTTGKAVILPA